MCVRVHTYACVHACVHALPRTAQFACLCRNWSSRKFEFWIWIIVIIELKFELAAGNEAGGVIEEVKANTQRKQNVAQKWTWGTRKKYLINFNCTIFFYCLFIADDHRENGSKCKFVGSPGEFFMVRSVQRGHFTEGR